jgi:hypothetical protein
MAPPLVTLMALCAVGAGAAQPSAAGRPPNSEIRAVQSACDAAIRSYSIDAPVDHMLPTHGIYIEGFGAAFITDVNLVALSPLFGFGGHVNPAELKRIHDSKVKRLPAVRELLTRMLMDSAKTLTRMAPEESVLLHVNFYYMDIEDRTGLPASMTVQAKKKDLLAAASGKLPAEAVSGILKFRVE